MLLCICVCTIYSLSFHISQCSSIFLCLCLFSVFSFIWSPTHSFDFDIKLLPKGTQVTGSLNEQREQWLVYLFFCSLFYSLFLSLGFLSLFIYLSYGCLYDLSQHDLLRYPSKTPFTFIIGICYLVYVLRNLCKRRITIIYLYVRNGTISNKYQRHITLTHSNEHKNIHTRNEREKKKSADSLNVRELFVC